MFVDKNNFSTSAGVTEVFHICQTWKTSVTPVYVLKLCLSTNMEDLSDTGICTEVILIYKHGRPQ
jgi:hypothetical protein